MVSPLATWALKAPNKNTDSFPGPTGIRTGCGPVLAYATISWSEVRQRRFGFGVATAWNLNAERLCPKTSKELEGLRINSAIALLKMLINQAFNVQQAFLKQGSI